MTKFSNRHVWANSVTQIWLVMKEQPDQGLHSMPLRLHCLDIHVQKSGKTILFKLQNKFKAIFWVSECLVFLRYLQDCILYVSESLWQFYAETSAALWLLHR